jgi:hypothetical protein
MTCEICGTALTPTNSRVIPEVERPDLDVSGPEIIEKDFNCCGECWKLWEAI